MNIISKSVGYDGYRFFCMRCGKAGYSTIAQVIGHLVICRSRKNIRRRHEAR